MDKEPSEIEITEPKPGDAQGIIEVRYKTWLATYPNKTAGIIVEDVEDRYKDRFSDKRIQRWEKTISHPEPGEKVLVAKDGDTIIGFCSVVTKNDRNQLDA